MTTQQILQGVHDWTNGKIVYDISVAHPDGQGKPTPYADLTAALGTGGANIPEPLRKGGMSVKFIQGNAQSSDNKYIQARLMANSFTTDVTQWQGVDKEPTVGSKNLVESGGVAARLKPFENNISVDTTQNENAEIKITTDSDEQLVYISEEKSLVKNLETNSLEVKDENENVIATIDENGANFSSLKKGNVDVIATNKIGFDYVDSEDSELVLSDDERTEDYAKFGSYGIKTKGLLNIDGSPIVNPSVYQYAYIRNGRLICNNDHYLRKNEGTENQYDMLAKYVQTKLDGKVIKALANISFHRNSVGTVLCIANYKYNNPDAINDITRRGSMHVVWGRESCKIGIYINDNWSYTTILYDNALPIIPNENVEYEVGYEYLGNDLMKVWLPDGSTQEVTVEGADDINGQYIMYEFFNDITLYPDRITNDFNRISINGVYCTCENGMPLIDNFKREDGFIGTAPSGHVYKLFRNICSTDTKYDITNRLY